MMMIEVLEGMAWRPGVNFHVLLCLLSLITCVSTSSASVKISEPDSKNTICHLHEFRARCGSNHVIMMTSALYGRMHQRACIKSNASIGCSANVLSQMDALCSGRRSCDVDISSEALLRNLPMRPIRPNIECISDIYKFMEASYKCVPVAPPSHKICQHQRRTVAPLVGQEGYVWNGLSSEDCNWHIRLHPGQRVNVTLYDFGVSRQPRRDGTCQKYANIQETGNNPIVCSGLSRTKNVFLSESNEVTIETFGVTADEENARFLLKYEAVGCSNPILPANSWLQRNRDTATIWCNSTGTPSQLTCTAGSWEGHIKPCNAIPEPGIVVIIVVGIILGIFIGGCLLGVVFFHHKRRERSRLTQMEESEYEAGFNDDNHVHLGDNALDYNYRVYGTDGTPRDPQQVGNKHALFTWKGNKYVEDDRCVCEPQSSKQITSSGDTKSPETPRQTPLRTSSGTGLPLFGKMQGKPGPDHVYETPK